MPRFAWRTSPEGRIYVSDRGMPPAAICSINGHARNADSVAATWAWLVRSHSRRTGLPESWILAMIGRESGGRATARNTETPPGLGLMQITAPALYARRGFTASDMLDADRNLLVGCDFLAWIKRCNGPDFPTCSSVYNAGGDVQGHPHTREGDAYPWGLLETAGHITDEVERVNYHLDHGADGAHAEPRVLWEPDDVTRAEILRGQAVELWAETGDLLEADRELARREHDRELGIGDSQPPDTLPDPDVGKDDGPPVA